MPRAGVSSTPAYFGPAHSNRLLPALRLCVRGRCRDEPAARPAGSPPPVGAATPQCPPRHSTVTLTPAPPNWPKSRRCDRLRGPTSWPSSATTRRTTGAQQVIDGLQRGRDELERIRDRSRADREERQAERRAHVRTRKKPRETMTFRATGLLATILLSGLLVVPATAQPRWGTSGRPMPAHVSTVMPTSRASTSASASANPFRWCPAE